MVPMEPYARMKPFAPSCEKNQSPILEKLKVLLPKERAGSLLEIGSGTGQHACAFSQHLPHITWQPSELSDKISDIQQWIEESHAHNCLSPIILDVTNPQNWPRMEYSAAFSANTAHALSWMQVIQLFQGVNQCLAEQGLFILYGPFNIGQQYTSNSNAEFDRWLKTHNPFSGIRDIEAIQALADDCGLKPLYDFEMPSHNRLLVWEK